MGEFGTMMGAIQDLAGEVKGLRKDITALDRAFAEHCAAEVAVSKARAAVPPWFSAAAAWLALAVAAASLILR